MLFLKTGRKNNVKNVKSQWDTPQAGFNSIIAFAIINAKKKNFYMIEIDTFNVVIHSVYILHQVLLSQLNITFALWQQYTGL